MLRARILLTFLAVFAALPALAQFPYGIPFDLGAAQSAGQAELDAAQQAGYVRGTGPRR